MKYRVFTRNWWKEATIDGWPDNLEPDPTARKHTLYKVSTVEEARKLCRQWNASHKPGRYSRKAEYEDIR